MRCHGKSRCGVQCKWTAASGAPEAAPLRGGSLYCAWHLPTHLRTDRYTMQDGYRQLKMDNLFTIKQRPRCQEVMLTQEQMDVIAMNRQAAAERRRLRQSQQTPMVEQGSAADSEESVEGPMLHTISADAGPLTGTTTITKEQLERIAANRQRALERRASRLQEADEQVLLSQSQHKLQQVAEADGKAGQEHADSRDAADCASNRASASSHPVRMTDEVQMQEVRAAPSERRQLQQAQQTPPAEQIAEHSITASFAEICDGPVTREIPADAGPDAAAVPQAGSATSPDERQQPLAATTTLAKEQLEQIAVNRRRALERRASRLQEADEQVLLSQSQLKLQQAAGVDGRAGHEQAESCDAAASACQRASASEELVGMKDVVKMHGARSSPRACSRTPPRQPSRRLTVSLTASPVLMPQRRGYLGMPDSPVMSKQTGVTEGWLLA
eukprot:TRINITY_DN8314_c0_g1_i1.p1 TRINITY_DN8314_c0_g1~~TRINITY_DN8314_c0_g1_i1.p1  ORF type:complete len:443 (+),score=88.65 TRINITY_DN8314_c0_g1_i1:74-1402(+)